MVAPVVDVAMQWNDGYSEFVTCFTRHDQESRRWHSLTGFRQSLLQRRLAIAPERRDRPAQLRRAQCLDRLRRRHARERLLDRLELDRHIAVGKQRHGDRGGFAISSPVSSIRFAIDSRR